MPSGFIVSDFLRRTKELSPGVELIYGDRRQTHDGTLRLSDVIPSEEVLRFRLQSVNKVDGMDTQN